MREQVHADTKGMVKAIQDNHNQAEKEFTQLKGEHKKV